MVKFLFRMILVVTTCTPPLFAANVPVDTSRSKVTVHVHESGLFSTLGHEHDIAAPIDKGNVDAQTRAVELTIKVEEMMVLDPGSTESDRRKRAEQSDGG
jgi:hypothetical protein